MKKKTFIIFIFTTLLFLLVSCKKDPYVKGYTFSSMGSVIQVQVYEKGKEQQAFDAVEDIFSFYGQITSNYRRNEVSIDSPYYNLNNIYLINQKAGIEPVEVTEELIEIIELSLKLHELTNGYFNIGLGKVLNVWKDLIENQIFIRKSKYLETKALLEDFGTPDLSKIVIDGNNVYLTDNQIELDLGAIAKGYATERAYKYLKEELGLKRFKINSGGSSIALALPPKDYPIKTYIADDNSRPGYPFYKDGLLGYIPGGNKHITTSGSGQQFVNVLDENNNFYTKVHHIVSPFTLTPINNYYKITLVGDNSMLLDAFSTAVFLMDVNDAITFLEKENIGYILYLKDYSLKTNLSDKEFIQYEIVGER